MCRGRMWSCSLCCRVIPDLSLRIVTVYLVLTTAHAQEIISGPVSIVTGEGNNATFVVSASNSWGFYWKINGTYVHDLPIHIRDMTSINMDTKNGSVLYMLTLPAIPVFNGSTVQLVIFKGNRFATSDTASLFVQRSVPHGVSKENRPQSENTSRNSLLTQSYSSSTGQDQLYPSSTMVTAGSNVSNPDDHIEIGLHVAICGSVIVVIGGLVLVVLLVIYWKKRKKKPLNVCVKWGTSSTPYHEDESTLDSPEKQLMPLSSSRSGYLSNHGDISLKRRKNALS